MRTVRLEPIDDPGAVQRAIDAVAAAGGGRVLLSSGTYAIGKLRVPRGCEVVGAGSGTVLRFGGCGMSDRELDVVLTELEMYLDAPHRSWHEWAVGWVER